MLEKIFHFIKYNNVAVIILAIILILGGGALAAGPEAIGQKRTSVQGVDNTALLSADLDKFNMDFKIEKIERDEKYYYATYSFLDLVVKDQAWQYQLSQRTQPVSQKIKQDIGLYLAKFLAKHFEARVRELKLEKSQAEAQGLEKRVEVTEYSGLIGRTLDLAATVFPGYEPVVKRELPAPENFNLPVSPDDRAGAPPASSVDSLTKVYNDYVAAHPEIFSASSTPSGVDAEASSTPADLIGSPPAPTDAASSTPASSTPEQIEPAADPASVEIISLPASPAPETAPVEPTNP